MPSSAKAPIQLHQVFGHPPTQIDDQLPAPWVLATEASSQPFRPTCRIGEALHPGPILDDDTDEEQIESSPSSILHIGCSNPSGRRQKEEHALDLGPGIWSFAETQLSQVTEKTCKKTLSFLASQRNRRLWVHAGAPAKLRSTSTWAGSWTGVLNLSDHPAHQLHLPWTPDIYQTGRILLTQHLVQQMPIQVATIYGYARGPTFPQALTLTSALLKTITTEFIIGSSGITLLQGDLNTDSTELDIYNAWRRYGWEELQTYCSQHFGWTPKPTSKHSKIRDHVWLSPEAQRYLVGMKHLQVFSEHSTLVALLQIPAALPRLRKWPKPQQIPWHEVDSQWDPSLLDFTGEDPTKYYAQFWTQIEASLDAHIQRDGPDSLTKAERGRGQTYKPKRTPMTPPTLKPSRAGEVQARSSFLSTIVKHWFKQLRRLQSLRHSLSAASTKITAIAYRIELWSAIRNSPGFRKDFPYWWEHERPLGRERYPDPLPLQVPSLEILTEIFHIFKENFEHFESWNLRQRGKLLQAKHDKTMSSIYQELKDAPRQQAQLLFNETKHEVRRLGDHTFYLTPPPPQKGTLTWSDEDDSIELHMGAQAHFSDPPGHVLEHGQQLCCRQYLSNSQEVQEELLTLWSSRWNKRIQPTQAEWERITALFQHQLPHLQIDHTALELVQWRRLLKKYKPTAARGADGISHSDLQNLNDQCTAAIFSLLAAIERGECSWPQQLLRGHCLALAKTANAHGADQHRPIVILSILYRTWSAYRARELIRAIAPHASSTEFGFLPQKEALQAWLLLQTSVERALQQEQPHVGISTDLKKAFNMIPRAMASKLAQSLGVPTEINRPWQATALEHSWLTVSSAMLQLHQ